MDGEREKNRQRKLNAQAGRDWDVEKDAADFAARGRGGGGAGGGFRRGAHGGVSGIIGEGLAGSRFAPQSGDEIPDEGGDLDSRPYNRGRGGRGGRAGRGGRGGRGRGGEGRGQAQAAAASNQRPPDASAEADFPALGVSPAAAAKSPASTPPVGTSWNADARKGTNEAIGDWADQVEASEPVPPV